jgi:hypothetical protein
MKKTMLLVIYLLTIVSSHAQIHYKESINIEAGVGINDMACISPVITAGYTFNSLIGAYGRYSFAIGSRPGLSFVEHNIEVYASFSPVQINEKIFFNFNPGAIIKLQDYKDLLPTPRTGKVNSGFMADIEIEWITGVYWALFSRVTFRSLFIDKHIRLEMFYNAGLRLSLNVFRVGEKYLVTPKKYRK